MIVPPESRSDGILRLKVSIVRCCGTNGGQSLCRTASRTPAACRRKGLLLQASTSWERRRLAAAGEPAARTLHTCLRLWPDVYTMGVARTPPLPASRTPALTSFKDSQRLAAASRTQRGHASTSCRDYRPDQHERPVGGGLGLSCGLEFHYAVQGCDAVRRDRAPGKAK